MIVLVTLHSASMTQTIDLESIAFTSYILKMGPARQSFGMTMVKIFKDLFLRHATQMRVAWLKHDLHRVIMRK